MKLIFLDIDGVLNDHSRSSSGYCTIDSDKVELFNQILDAHPNARVVISSAWRLGPGKRKPPLRRVRGRTHPKRVSPVYSNWMIPLLMPQAAATLIKEILI